MRVDASAHASATQAVAKAADATGVDFSLLLQTAQRESGLNQNAHAGNSSATGLFQFLDSTWMNVVDRYGAKHGLNVDVHDPSQRQQILDLRYDPEISAMMAGELTRENAASLQSKLGRAATDSELYAAHVLGPAKAAKLIEAAQSGQANAAALDPRAAHANRNLFYTHGGAALSASEVMAKFDIAASAPTPQIEETSAPPTPRAAISTLINALAPTSLIAQAGPALWSLALRAYSREDDE